MASKKHKPTHSNHERWMVSYADFVTLLFALFVVMFATANSDRAKAGIVSAAIREALHESKPVTGTGGLSDVAGDPRFKQTSSLGLDKNPTEMARAMKELLPSMQLLERELKPEIDKGNVELHMSTRGLTISLKQAAFFDSGSDLVKPSALPTIAKVGEALRMIPNSVRLEGHTDNVPISTGRFSSNWALSSSRAIAVLNVLTDELNIPRLRLAVGGYADVAPVASNDTEEGRARNRRVDVVILSESGTSAEPQQTRKVAPAKKS
jgi:chemotaxis protein MotB